jgi:hypothetical protein
MLLESSALFPQFLVDLRQFIVLKITKFRILMDSYIMTKYMHFDLKILIMLSLPK